MRSMLRKRVPIAVDIGRNRYRGISSEITWGLELILGFELVNPIPTVLDASLFLP